MQWCMVGGSRSILTWWIGCVDANQYGAHLGADDELYLAKDARGIFKGTFGLLYFLHVAFFQRPKKRWNKHHYRSGLSPWRAQVPSICACIIQTYRHRALYPGACTCRHCKMSFQQHQTIKTGWAREICKAALQIESPQVVCKRIKESGRGRGGYCWFIVDVHTHACWDHQPMLPMAPKEISYKDLWIFIKN